jgi:carbohydrate kinase (thermoresistant glucokinase family)
MGVSSSGKTLIGSKLAGKLGLPFYDADDFHPPKNVEKMESGKPLNDQDRMPWLRALQQKKTEWEQAGGAVLACSALKKSYRTILSPQNAPVRFIYLKGSKELIARRMEQRSDHFMPEELLDSQFEALEEPARAITADIDQTPEEIVSSIGRKIDNQE